jgi:hypothetical protein
VATVPAAPEAPEIASAVEGKTLRGSKKPGAPETHRCAVLTHRGGLTLTPQAVAATTQESTEVETVCGAIVLAGRLVTRDALRPQRQGAQPLVAAGGASVLSVTDHQPPLKAAIALVCTLPRAGDRHAPGRTVDIGQGRLETRTLTTREALVGYSPGPGLAQVCEGGRQVLLQKTGQERGAVVSGVTSLTSERATPGRVLDLVRGHGSMEHTSHGGRDGTCDEDRSPVRCGRIPPVLAALRHTALGLLRWAGHTPIAAACRRLAAQPAQALALIGIEFEN